MSLLIVLMLFCGLIVAVKLSGETIDPEIIDCAADRPFVKPPSK